MWDIRCKALTKYRHTKSGWRSKWPVGELNWIGFMWSSGGTAPMHRDLGRSIAFTSILRMDMKVILRCHVHVGLSMFVDRDTAATSTNSGQIFLEIGWVLGQGMLICHPDLFSPTQCLLGLGVEWRNVWCASSFLTLHQMVWNTPVVQQTNYFP